MFDLAYSSLGRSDTTAFRDRHSANKRKDNGDHLRRCETHVRLGRECPAGPTRV